MGVLIADKAAARETPDFCGMKPGAQSTMQPDGERDCAVKKRLLWLRRQRLRRPLSLFVTWEPVGRATKATD